MILTLEELKEIRRLVHTHSGWSIDGKALTKKLDGYIQSLTYKDESRMKILIIVYDDGEWKRDTLESRMVDVRLESLIGEFERNQVPTEIIRRSAINYDKGMKRENE